MSRYGKTVFRAINEQVRLVVEPFETLQRMARQQPVPVPFVCECRSEECFDSVDVTLAEYEAICADDEHRLIVPGHQVEGEQVVVETPAYAVVRLAELGEPGWSRPLEPRCDEGGTKAGRDGSDPGRCAARRCAARP